MQAWVTEESRTADFGDRRLDKRFATLLDQLSGHPTHSIPAACGGWAETHAAYRFFAVFVEGTGAECVAELDLRYIANVNRCSI